MDCRARDLSPADVSTQGLFFLGGGGGHRGQQTVKPPNRLWSSSNSYSKSRNGIFSQGLNSQDVKLNTHLLLVPRLRMRGSIPPLHMLLCHKPREIFYLWTPYQLVKFSTFDSGGNISSFFHSVYIKLSLLMSLRPVGIEVLRHLFVTSALDVAQWSASRPGVYYVFGTVPDTLWKGGWMCPKTGLGVFEKRNSLAWPGIEPPYRPARSPVTMLEPVRLEVTDFVQVVRNCCSFWFVWYLVSLRSTYQQHLICFDNVIFTVSGLLSCWFRSLYSIPTQKRIETWERPLFFKTVQYEIWGSVSVVEEDTGLWDVRLCHLVKSYINFGGPFVSLSRVWTLQDISRWRY
jgi:hypothetical protein